MKNVILTAALVLGAVQTGFAAEAASTEASTQKDAVYQDYKWDIGLVGSMIAEGFSGDKRLPTGLGLHGAYHITNNVSVHVEYIEFVTVLLENDGTNNKNTDRNFDASVAYDFSPERVYSLYAKGGLGYEGLSNDDDSFSDVVLMMGAGARYIFTDNVGGYLEGRWKYGFNESGNSLMGVMGVDYSF